MTKRNQESDKRLRLLIAAVVGLLCAGIALALAHKELIQRGSTPVTGTASQSGESSASNVKAVNFVQPLPQTGAQFDLSRNVIAGGGGTSTGGNLQLDGTVGQPAAGTQMSSGQYSVAGGFWQPAATGAAPTPTPAPTPTSTPTPTPTSFTILVVAGNPNQAVALDSVTFVRGPFRTRTNHNFSSDRLTRVILFTTNLGLTQADVSKVTVSVAGISLPVENVGPVFGVAGLEASYIVVRLVDGLPPGDLPLTITVNGVSSSNSSTLPMSP